MESNVISFNVKLMNGDIYPITISSQITTKNLKKIIEDLFPDKEEYYEAYWFYCDNLDSELDSKEQLPFPKNNETICAFRRVKIPEIHFIDSWNCYDTTYHRWYDDYTIVIQIDNNNELILDFRFRKTIEGNFFFKQDNNKVKLIEENFRDNVTRIVQFPHQNEITHFTSLYELLLTEYENVNVPFTVFDIWITEADKEWNNKISNKIKIRPDEDPIYE